MMLHMKRLQKHPTTGIYRVRRRVPAELQEILGKRELIKTLRTKDPVVAASRFPKVDQELASILEEARRSIGSVSPEMAQLRVALRKASAAGIDVRKAIAEVGPDEEWAREAMLEELLEQSEDHWGAPQSRPRKGKEREVDVLLHGHAGARSRLPFTVGDLADLHIVETGRDLNDTDRHTRRYIARMRSYVAKFASVLALGDKTPVFDVVRDDALRWREMIVREGATRETIRGQLSYLKSIFETAIGARSLSMANPFDAVKLPRNAAASTPRKSI